MFAVRSMGKLCGRRCGVRAKSQFIGSGVCGMPRNRISTCEKVTLATCMFAFWFPYPVWVMWNFESYKKGPKA